MIDQGLWQEAKKNRVDLFLSIVLGFCCGGSILAQAYLLAGIVDGVFLQGASLEMLWPKLLLLLLVMTVRSGLSYLEEWFALRLAVAVQGHLRGEIIGKIERLGPVAMNGEQRGQILNMVNEGVELLEGYFSQYLPQLFKSAGLPVLFLLFIWPIDWISGLILLVTAPLVPFFMMLIGKWTEGVNRKQWGILNRLSGYLQDVLAGLTTLKMLNRSEQQGKKIAEVSDAYRRSTLSVLRWAFLSALTLELFTTISIAVVSVGLGVRLVEGLLDFRSAFFLLLLAPEFYLPLRTLGGHFHTSLNGVAAWESVEAFLTLPDWVSRENEESGEPLDGLDVVFEEVSFYYPGQSVPALEKVSFHLAPGERVALVGPSGSGKTTVLHLLLGFIEPTEGRILINGRDYLSLNQQALNKKMALVPQHPYLFGGTILDNITLGQADRSLGEVEEICKDIGLDRLLADLPLALETVVGAGGQDLSGGQRQLVAMARAMLKKADLVLMDEATANLDLVTEDQLQKALPVLLANKGALVIAHRLSTVTQMDKIMVLDGGKVVQVGTHHELMAQEGLYGQMVKEGVGHEA